MDVEEQQPHIWSLKGTWIQWRVVWNLIHEQISSEWYRSSTYMRLTQFKKEEAKEDDYWQEHGAWRFAGFYKMGRNDFGWLPNRWGRKEIKELGKLEDSMRRTMEVRGGRPFTFKRS